MDINELISLIGNVGFPVAVSTYLLIKLEKLPDVSKLFFQKYVLKIV
ncbi:YvrJ family protein [Clostridium botulinum]|nr:YvrJ family protein [Clostridium botulinum]NFL44327.1 YvrJ family protein [Clostridium botulinum]NFL88596.1 YvrJ family protein [Clostridium botulinum]